MTDARKVAAKFRLAMEHATPEALETYLKQHPKAKRDKHKVKQSDPKPARGLDPERASAPASSTEFRGILKPADADLTELVGRHKAEFDKIDTEADSAVKSFKPSTAKIMLDFDTEDPDSDQTDYMAQSWSKLSPAEKRIHVAGHKVGEKFEKSLTAGERKMHDHYLHDWHSSATSFDNKGYDDPKDFVHTSQELQGLLSSLGVSGTPAPEDEALDKTSQGGLKRARTKAANDHRLTGYVKKMYDYQQAYFRNAGIKEITLYRGVKGPEVDGAAEGGKVKVQSRELASFTADPNIAKRFGRVIEFKVPVERVFASSIVRPSIGSEAAEHSSKEAEFLIMGASDLEGQTIGSARGKTASEVIEVPISDENADWLQNGHKKNKTAAERVLARFVAAKSKGLSLVPDYKEALAQLEKGDATKALAFAKRLVEIILPGGERPAWFTALSVQKSNAVERLYKDAIRFEGSGVVLSGKEPQHRDAWIRYMVMEMSKWAKDLRTLELASAIADTEGEIQHGPFTVVPIPGITKKQVEDALAALDEASSKIRPKFPQVLYGKVFLSKHLKKNVAAWYDAGTDTLALNVLARKRVDDIYTITHELGHRHDFKFVSKAAKRKFWDLSTRKIFETVTFDEKLREQMAAEVVALAKYKATGKTPVTMSDMLVMWLKSPHPHLKGDIRKLTSDYLQGKLEEKDLFEAVKGKRDEELSTGKVLHGPLSVTPYGATKVGENYAEAFAHFVLGMNMPSELAVIIAEESNGHSKTAFWGSAGAGCIPYCTSTKRICIQLRSGLVDEPHTWGTFGGAIDGNEIPVEAARRELQEEAGYRGSVKLKKLSTFRKGDFEFHNFLARVPEEFEPRHSWESSDHRWCTLDDLPSPLHFGFKAVLPSLRAELGA